MMMANTLVKIKVSPYSIELETPVLLNSLAHALPDKLHIQWERRVTQGLQIDGQSWCDQGHFLRFLLSSWN